MRHPAGVFGGDAIEEGRTAGVTGSDDARADQSEVAAQRSLVDGPRLPEGLVQIQMNGCGAAGAVAVAGGTVDVKPGPGACGERGHLLVGVNQLWQVGRLAFDPEHAQASEPGELG